MLHNSLLPQTLNPRIKQNVNVRLFSVVVRDFIIVYILCFVVEGASGHFVVEGGSMDSPWSTHELSWIIHGLSPENSTTCVTLQNAL